VLYAIVRPTLDTIVGEIERSYRFAMGRLSGVTTGPLYLIGGGARLKGLVEVLGSRLGVPVSLPDPKTVLKTESADGQEHPLCNATNFPAMAACVGLALMEEDT
jgi:Tfp pilus assembly PilM family ATPase